MYLSKLKLFGFKSFANKSEIAFDEGITCIVGPNGCGKTNVVDAIRWVLGEQRITSLRGDKMENVIFNGSEDKKPLGMSEVSLIIENTKNILPIEYSEVEIKRRIYRSGESEYYLNNSQCRLRDIVNLFMDTGMGADAYSIIELKMVEQILSDKLEDRKRLFEEAAGITKFKKRRSETFKKLEDTRQDLYRVNDIIIEVERKVTSLKRQTAKVRRYQRIREELKTKENEIYRSSFFNIRLKKKPLIENINNFKSQQDLDEGEFAKNEAQLEKLKSDLVILENNLSEFQQEYNDLVDVLNNEQMELTIAKEKKSALNENIRKIETEEIDISGRIANNEIERRENNEKLNILSEKIDELQTEHNKFKEKLNIFYEDYYEKKNRLSTAQSKIVELIEKHSEKSRKLDKILSDLSQREEKISSMTKESKWIKERLLNKEQILDSLITENTKIEDFINEKSAERSKIQKDVEAKKVMVDELKDKIINLKNQIEIDEKRIEFLYQIISEKGKLSEGTEYLLRNKDSIDGLLGTIGELIDTDKKYQKAVMSALNWTSNFLIFDNAENAFNAIKLIAEKTSGGVDIIPLDKINDVKDIELNLQNRAAISDESIVGWANEVVKCDKKFKKIIDFILYDVLITKDNIIEKGSWEVVKEKSVSVVDLSGTMIDRYGIVHSIGEGRESEVNDKLTEIEKIKVKIEQAKENVNETENLSADYLKQIEEFMKKLDLINYEISNSEKRHREIENEISVSEFDVKKDKEQLAKMEKERKQLEIFDVDRGEFEKQNAELKMLKEEQTRLQVEIEKLKIQDDQLEENRKTLETAANEENLRLVKFQEELKRVEIDYKRNVELGTEYKRKIQSGKESILKISEEIKRWEEKGEESREKINKLTETKSEFEEKVNNVRIKQANLKNEILEEEKILKGQRYQKEKRANEIFEAEVELTKLEQEEKTLMEKIGTSISEISEADRLEETEIELKKNIIEALQEKLNKLGQINFAALEEYQEEKERYDNLVNQRNDIINAEETLIETIQKINDTAREKFIEIFEKIRMSFRDVYTKFFEDGEADLLLTEDSDPLEAKIGIVSRPSGKKLNSISLLSAGEKALTAIALLMSIYMVKPSPFCVLDEVDAPLDDSNIERFTNVLRLFSKNTQFIVVTHNKKTMESANFIYGVTMEESGISKIVSTKLV